MKIYIFFLALLFSVNHAQAEDLNSGCDLDGLTAHPIEPCVKRYEQQLKLLNQKQHKWYQAEIKRLEKIKKASIYEDYALLFKDYPSPEVLFKKLDTFKLYLQSGLRTQKDNLCYDCVTGITLLEYENHMASYQIIVAMLEKRKRLTNDAHTNAISYKPKLKWSMQ